MAEKELERIRSMAKICEELNLSLFNILHFLFYDAEVLAIINQVGIEKIIDFLKLWKGEIEVPLSKRYNELRIQFLEQYKEELKREAREASIPRPKVFVAPEEVYEYMAEKGLVSKEEIETYVKVSELFNKCLLELSKKREKESTA